MALSVDGSRIVSGFWDNSIRVWDSRTGAQERVLEGHSDVVCVCVVLDVRRGDLV